MNPFNLAKSRNIVPRWRPVARSIELAEATPVAPKNAPELAARYRVGASELLNAAAAAFEQAPSLPNAAEMVAIAVLAGEPAKARKAASMMQRELGADQRPLRQCIEENVETAPATLQQDAIRSFRRSPRFLQDDGLTWLDLALAHASCGNYKKAERALMVARRLMDPQNRLLARAEARFYQHVGDVPRALAALQRLGGHLYADPWLLAPQIGLATLAQQRANTASRARHLVQQRHFAPYQGSELAAAIATLELTHGSHKRARRFFDQANEDPAEQVVAQTVWARSEDTLIHLPADVKRSAEAEARVHFENGDWDAAHEAAGRWLADEPFATSPAFLITNLKATLLDDPGGGLKAARQGLQSNPEFGPLLNTGAYAAALSGEIGQAKAMLAKINLEKSRNRSSDEICMTATRGLIAYREGDHARGRALYGDALRKARALEGAEDLPTRVAIFHLKSALVVEDIETLRNADMLQTALRPIKSPETLAVRTKVISDLMSARICPSEALDAIEQASKRERRRSEDKRVREGPTLGRPNKQAASR